MTIDTTNDGNVSETGEEEGEDQTDTTTTTEHKEEQRNAETPEQKRARLDRQIEQHRKKHPELYESKTISTDTSRQKSNGLDLGAKAYLAANGIKGESETKFVQKFMQETGKDIEQVLESKFFKAELEEMRELAKTEDATPSGKRSGNSAVDSVEYWLTKPIEDVPKEMRTKVVNAKIEQEKTKGVFYNS